jgi:hypothetical protein
MPWPALWEYHGRQLECLRKFTKSVIQNTQFSMFANYGYLLIITSHLQILTEVGRLKCDYWVQFLNDCNNTITTKQQ